MPTSAIKTTAACAAALLLAAVLAAPCPAQSNQAAPLPEELYSGPDAQQKNGIKSTKLNMRGVRKKGTTDVGPIDMLGTSGRADTPGSSKPDGDCEKQLPE